MITTPAPAIVSIPGWNGSGPDHWQTLWEAEYSHAIRVEQRDWNNPTRTEWVAALSQVVRRQTAPVVLVAHSLGCITVAHWARSADLSQIAGAFLVGPPWIHENDCPPELTTFLPIPANSLPFPSVLIASENDPYIEIATAHTLARAWGSEFVNIGEAGHINARSGHGPWPEGKALLREFIEKQTGAVAASNQARLTD